MEAKFLRATTWEAVKELALKADYVNYRPVVEDKDNQGKIRTVGYYFFNTITKKIEPVQALIGIRGAEGVEGPSGIE